MLASGEPPLASVSSNFNVDFELLLYYNRCVKFIHLQRPIAHNYMNKLLLPFVIVSEDRSIRESGHQAM